MEGKQSKIAARQTTHYHLARQLAVIKEAGLYIQTPEDHADLVENALVSVINSMKYNTSDLGLTCKILLQVYQPLLELGLKDFRHLLTRNRKLTIMSSKELANNQTSDCSKQTNLDREQCTPELGPVKMENVEHKGFSGHGRQSRP